MDIKETLMRLSEQSAVGTVKTAADTAYEILSKYARTEKTDNLTVIGFIKGASDKTLMLDAHIDEVAMIVTDVDDGGFITVAKSGGIDLRTLPAARVTVHGKRDIKAVFCSTPPHLSSGEAEYDDISKLKIDTALGSKAKEIVSVGDYVTYDVQPVSLFENIVTGKSLDDRAGVVCLLELAERLSDKKLPHNVAFVLSDGEELGLRGSKTATFSVEPDEAIAIDVSFGDGPDISPDDCGKVSHGAMIGISPVLDKEISRRLCECAEELGNEYQTEVMGGRTGTNGDVISVTKGGVRTGIVSIPLRNMHTGAELVDVRDIANVCDILEKYILSGGVLGD